jgi:HSP20 family protein
MSNVIVRKQNGDKPATAAPETWDPWRTMRSLLSWDPFREMAPFPVVEDRAMLSPAFDVKETKDAYLFKADVPGIPEKDLEVTITGNRLNISGTRRRRRRTIGTTRTSVTTGPSPAASRCRMEPTWRTCARPSSRAC